MSALADVPSMANDEWRERLKTAIEDSGKSARALSLASGNGEGYVHSVLKGKDPTIERLMAVCDAIPVSATYVLYGVDVTPEDAELLRTMKESPEARAAVLTLLRAHRPA